MTLCSTLILCILLLIPLASPHDDYPSCSYPSTYTNYSRSTPPKGLRQSKAWDRTARKLCDFGTGLSEVEESCGDCDVGILKSGVWYRFNAPNSVVSVVRVVDDVIDSVKCPTIGYCNGYNQILLSRSAQFITNHIDSYYHRVVVSRNGMCSILGENVLDDFVKVLRCGSFYLYRFPAVLERELSCYGNVSDDHDKNTSWQPYSLCLTDSVVTAHILWTWYVVIGIVFVMATLIFIVAFFFYKQNVQKRRSDRYTNQLSVDHVTFTRQSTHLYDDLCSMGVNMAQARVDSNVVVVNPLAIEQVLTQLNNHQNNMLPDEVALENQRQLVEREPSSQSVDDRSFTPQSAVFDVSMLEDPLSNAIAQDTYDSGEVDQPTNDEVSSEPHVALLINDVLVADEDSVNEEPNSAFNAENAVHNCFQPYEVMTYPTSVTSVPISVSEPRQFSTTSNYITMSEFRSDKSLEFDNSLDQSARKRSSNVNSPRVSKLVRRSTHLYEDLLSLGLTPLQASDYIRLQSCSGPLTSEMLNSLAASDYIIPNEVLPYLEDLQTKGKTTQDIDSYETNGEDLSRDVINQRGDCEALVLSDELSSDESLSDLVVKIPETLETRLSECESCRNDSCCSGLGSPGILNTSSGTGINTHVITDCEDTVPLRNKGVKSVEKEDNIVSDMQRNTASDPLSRLSKADRVKIIDDMNRVSFNENRASCACNCSARKEKTLRLCSV